MAKDKKMWHRLCSDKFHPLSVTVYKNSAV